MLPKCSISLSSRWTVLDKSCPLSFSRRPDHRAAAPCCQSHLSSEVVALRVSLQALYPSVLPCFDLGAGDKEGRGVNCPPLMYTRLIFLLSLFLTTNIGSKCDYTLRRESKKSRDWTVMKPGRRRVGFNFRWAWPQTLFYFCYTKGLTLLLPPLTREPPWSYSDFCRYGSSSFLWIFSVALKRSRDFKAPAGQFIAVSGALVMY